MAYYQNGTLLFRASIFLFLTFLLSTSASFASQADRAYSSATQSYSKLDKSKKLQQSVPNWEKVINNFETFIEKYPKDSRVTRAMLTLGDLYERLYLKTRKNEYLNSSIESYRSLPKRFPKSSLADDAIFKTGEIYLKHRGNRESAYIEYKKVMKKYPKGDMVAKAKARISELSAETQAGRHENMTSAGAESDTKLASVNVLKHWSNPDYTRIVIYSDNKVSYREAFLKEDGDRPPRLFLDITEARLGDALKEPVTINDGLLKMARAGQYDKQTVRVVLDIESIDSYKIFPLVDPYRIVIDVSGERRDEADPIDSIEDIIAGKTIRKEDPAAKTAATVSAVTPSIAKIPPKPSLAQQLGLGIRKVVLDPGHGGHDPGAIGYGGIREKDVVLQIGKKLRDQLVNEYGLEVIMTRETDVFLPLEERTAIANTVGADLFISIHANASRNKKAGGVETYFLNFATDEDSMRLAATENATTTKNISDLQTILNDLMLNSKINESSKLARYVQGSMLDGIKGNGSKSKNRGVKQAPFYVLIGAQMPSILVETSFITNKDEAKRLASNEFQATLAGSIAEGVKRYSELVRVAGR